MIFRIRDLEAILFAVVISCVLPLAKAQSTGGDHIIYSSPQGKVASSAPVPMAQAPQSQELESPPSSQMGVNIFADPAPQQMFPNVPPAQPQNNAQNQDDFTDPMGLHKEFSIPTTAEMMKVPTPEQIFGIPDQIAADAATKPSDLTTGDTNGLSLETSDEPAWANVWSRETGGVNSNGTEQASGFFGGFFDSATRNENGFGDHFWGSTETSFVPPQTSEEQGQSWASALDTSTPPAPDEPAQNNFSSPNNPSDGGSGSQSPFLPPQVRRFDNAKMLPQLPALPVLPGRKEVDTTPPAAPSWALQPPPWTQPQTPFGTPVQLNPQR